MTKPIFNGVPMFGSLVLPKKAIIGFSISEILFAEFCSLYALDVLIGMRIVIVMEDLR
jgi:hypothetical protein